MLLLARGPVLCRAVFGNGDLRLRCSQLKANCETTEEAGLGKERKGAMKSFRESMSKRPQGWKSSAEWSILQQEELEALQRRC